MLGWFLRNFYFFCRCHAPWFCSLHFPQFIVADEQSLCLATHLVQFVSCSVANEMCLEAFILEGV